MVFLRPAALLLGALLLVGCAKNDLKEPPVPLGDFVLGLNIVVADNVKKVPISREASPDEWETVMKAAVADRFGRYEGSRLYNIGISVDGYALAPPGIPVVAAPKSVLVITANIWDDAKQKKLNEEGFRITVFESLSGDTVIGTGLTRTKKQQMEALSYNAVHKVQDWLLSHPEWFAAADGAVVAAPVAVTAAPPAKPVAAPVAVAPVAPATPVPPPAAPAPAPTATPAPTTGTATGATSTPTHKLPPSSFVP